MTDITDPQAELWLNDLLLTGDNFYRNYVFTIEALDEDATPGEPVPIDVSVQRWMAEGAAVATEGYENRTPSFKVVVSADTSVDLAGGEAALIRNLSGPSLLKWIAPQGAPDAPASIFEVWTGHLTALYDGMDELQLQRTYQVTLTAKPWVRSENPVTIAAVQTAVTASSITVDAGTSTTGWTGSPNGATTSGGAVRVSRTVSTTGRYSLSLTRAGAVSGMLSTPYLRIDASVTGGSDYTMGVSVDGFPLTRAGSNGTVSWWQMPAGDDAFSSLVISAVVGNNGVLVHNLTLAVADVTRTNVVGTVGTHKQLVRRFDVGGSVKTSGSIQLASPTATGLGMVVVYTYEDDGSGYTPAMRAYRTTGLGTTPDNTAVSGVREAFVTSGSTAGLIEYAIPANVIREGTYALVGRWYSATVDTMTVVADMSITAGTAGVADLPSTERMRGSVTWTAAGYQWGVIGTVSLPRLALPAESQLKTLIELSGDSATGTMTLDDIFLFDLTHGSLSMIQTIGSLNATRMWIDAADVDPVRNRPAVYQGTSADRSDALAVPYSQILSLGDHDLDPDGAVIFTVTDKVDDAAASASFYRRWHTHAGS